jgi:hypothetical protein
MYGPQFGGVSPYTMGGGPSMFAAPPTDVSSFPGSFPGANTQRFGMGFGMAPLTASAAFAPGPISGAIGGGLLGGFGGAALGAGLGIAALPITTSISMTAMNMSAVGNILQSNRFLMGSGTGQMGASGGFSSSQIAGVASGVRNIAGQDAMASVGETRDIMNQLSSSGFLQSSKDVPDMMRKFGETMKALATMARAMQTSLSDALPAMMELRSAGFASPAMMGGMVTNMAAGQRGGVSMMQQMSAGSAAAQSAMMSGLSGPQAFMGGVQATQQLGVARQSGAITEEMFRGITMGTGRAEVGAAQMAQSAQQAAMGPLGLIVGAGRINMSQMGGASFGANLRGAEANLRSPDSIIKLLNRRDEAAGQILQDPMMNLGQIANSMAMEIPGNQQENRMLILQNVLQQSPIMARTISAMYDSRFSTEMQLKTYQRQNDEQMRVEDRRRELFGQVGFRKLLNRKMADLGFEQISSLTESAAAAGGGMFENIYRNITGGQREARGAAVHKAMAKILTGTFDEDFKVGDLGAAGSRYEVNTQTGFLGTGGKVSLASERGQKAVFGEIFKDDAAKDAAIDDLLKKTTMMTAMSDATPTQKLMAALGSGATQSRVAEIQSSYLAASQQAGSAGNVIEKIERMVSLPDSQRISNKEMALATVANEGRSSEILAGLRENAGNTEVIADKMDAALASFGSSIRVGVHGAGSFLFTSESNLAKEIAQDTELAPYMQDILSKYGEERAGEAAADENVLLTKVREKHGDAKAERLSGVLKSMRGDPKRSQQASKHLLTYSDNEKTFQTRTAFKNVAANITAGLRSVSGSASGSKLFKLLQDFATVSLTAGQTGKTKAVGDRSTLIVQEAIKAIQQGTPEEAAQAKELLTTAGMGALPAAIMESSRSGVSGGSAEMVDIVQKRMLSSLLGTAKDGQKLSAMGVGGSPQDQFNESLTRYIQGNTRLMSAMLSIAADNSPGRIKKALDLGSSLSKELGL